MFIVGADNTVKQLPAWHRLKRPNGIDFWSRIHSFDFFRPRF